MKSLLLIVLLAGCANLPGDPSKMSAEQRTAMSKDRSASAACTFGVGPWGTVRTVFVQLDQKTIATGGVTVGTDCTITINSEAAAAARAALRAVP